MVDLGEGLRSGGEKDDARDRTILAFLDIGEKLKSFYQRGLSPRPAPNGRGAASADLAMTIESEIIPRLLLAYKAEDESLGARESNAPGAPISTEERRLFVSSILSEGAGASRQIVDRLIARGVARDTLYLDLLAGAARGLGEMWDRDEADFTDVTIGLCRLHDILREISAEGMRRFRGEDPTGTILLSTACGDPHGFGVVMVAEFFRDAGWSVWVEPGARCPDLAALLATEVFDMLALSAALSVPSDAIAKEIGTLRAASRNRAMKVIVGGRLFDESPALAESVGADAYAGDAATAPQIGLGLLAAARPG
jgi:methanogenic corrinoid protein MtbC1